MRARVLTTALLAAALLVLPACFWRDSASASYWKGVEQTAKQPSSAHLKKSRSASTRAQSTRAQSARAQDADEKRPRSYRQPGRTKSESGKLAAARGLLEVVLEHGFLVRVKPWERDLLAREHMSWSPDALRAARRSHIYFSKESSLVGGSAGGGGCGCN